MGRGVAAPAPRITASIPTQPSDLLLFPNRQSATDCLACPARPSRPMLATAAPSGAGGEALEIIPVIDLKGGVAVRARMGERASYAAIDSPLSRSSDPVDVARGYLGIHEFRRIYVADLDGIEGRGRDDRTLARLNAAFPDIEFWVDNGLRDEAACRAWLRQDLGRLVLGSESQRDETLPGRLGAVLSLDFRGETFLGPTQLLDDARLWPDEVIVMTLARVGSNLGPDLARLGALKAKAPRAQVYAAGGVRNSRDLAALEAAGASGALVASALHDGRIGRRELAATARSP